jgi:NADPH-dependent 2,4-dienoyl-CoA reductase/sulfur reductase-like enzyme
MTDTIVIAGASIAGLSAARELRRGGFDGRIVTVDRDTHAPYRRPEVSKALLKIDLADSRARLSWSEDLDATRIAGELTGLDTARRRVLVEADGQHLELAYDGLVVATGAQSRPSPFPPIRGVHSLRSSVDSAAFRAELGTAREVVFVGAGFIGLEVASVLRGLGRSVTIVEPMAAPLAHILGPDFSTELRRKHEAQDVRFRLGVGVTELVQGDDGHVRGVLTGDGDLIPADLVLVAVGSTPSTGWLSDSALTLDVGVVCDASCAAVGVDGVVAAGDIAVWHNPQYDRSMRVEHWSHAIEQATYAARRLLGSHDPEGFRSIPYFWTEQVGLRIQSLGSTSGHDEVVVLDRDPATMFVAYVKAGVVVAIAGFAAGATIFQFRDLLATSPTVAEVRDRFESLQKAA